MSITKELHMLLGIRSAPKEARRVGGEKPAPIEHSLCGKTSVGNSHKKRQFVGQIGSWKVHKRRGLGDYTPKSDTS